MKPAGSRSNLPSAEKAILVGVALGSTQEAEESLHELERLVHTAGGQIVGKLLQRRTEIDPRTFLGRGKVEELRQLTGRENANLIVFDNDLTPGQARSLEDDTQIRILDRSELILDIFAKYARSHQAKVQVELAQLEYIYPRLRRMWTHLEKTEGRIGTRGPGETQLETDRRLIRNQIQRLKRKLKEIEGRKRREVQARAGAFTVSLVGYTNAGKSTLLNRLTGTQVTTRDQLFTTLDTKTHVWNLDLGRKVLLSDTVGFLRNLPHHLVASFHATLEEACHADLLLHVVDASHPAAVSQMEAVEKVLEEIGAAGRSLLVVFNKIDLITNWMEVETLRKKCAEPIMVSAKTGEGLDKLRATVRTFLERDAIEVIVRTSASNGRAIHALYEYGKVLESGFEENEFFARIRCSPAALGELRGKLGTDSQIQQIN